jgi:hypothetical protein
MGCGLRSTAEDAALGYFKLLLLHFPDEKT